MFLTPIDILGPVTGVGVLIVQQTTDAQLFSGGSIPAGPVPRAGRLVAEDAVQPVTVLRTDRGVCRKKGHGNIVFWS